MKSTLASYGARLALVALVQVGVLGKIVYDRVSLIKSGREIALQVIPIDPRDVFRGEYVILGYDISQLTLPLDSNRIDFDHLTRGKTVYATLAPGAEGNWSAKAVTLSYPATVGADEVVLKGRVRVPFLVGPERAERIAVRYGIESYFVPEGTGRALEQSVRDKKIQALVAVAPDGTAALKGLVIGGERHEDPPML